MRGVGGVCINNVDNDPIQWFNHKLSPYKKVPD